MSSQLPKHAEYFRIEDLLRQLIKLSPTAIHLGLPATNLFALWKRCHTAASFLIIWNQPDTLLLQGWNRFTKREKYSTDCHECE